MFTKKVGGITAIPSWFPKGAALLRDPSLNKGTAFTAAERDALGLRGLLPHHPNTQAEQVERVLENFRRKTSNLDKYVNLAACLLYTSPSPRDRTRSRMPSSA